MHISDGVLSPPVLGAGFAAAGLALAATTRRLTSEEMPRAAVMTSAFFVASLIRVPLGPTSLHLVLNGLAGVLLGAAAFPAIAVGLVLQAALFQHGGLTTLGVNACVMGFPAVLAGFLYRAARARAPERTLPAIAGALCVLAILLSGALLAAALLTTGESFRTVAEVALLAHLPLAATEGAVGGAVARFLLRVKPELVRAPKAAAALCAALALLLPAAPARAHRLLAEVVESDGGARVEAFFSDGAAARGARVEARDGSGRALSGETDERGVFVLSPGALSGTVEVVVLGRDGHRAEARADLSAPPPEGAAPKGRRALPVPWGRVALGVAVVAALAAWGRRALPKRPGGAS